MALNYKSLLENFLWRLHDQGYPADPSAVKRFNCQFYKDHGYSSYALGQHVYRLHQAIQRCKVPQWLHAESTLKKIFKEVAINFKKKKSAFKKKFNSVSGEIEPFLDERGRKEETKTIEQLTEQIKGLEERLMSENLEAERLLEERQLLEKAYLHKVEENERLQEELNKRKSLEELAEQNSTVSEMLKQLQQKVSIIAELRRMLNEKEDETKKREKRWKWNLEKLKERQLTVIAEKKKLNDELNANRSMVMDMQKVSNSKWKEMKKLKEELVLQNARVSRMETIVYSGEMLLVQSEAEVHKLKNLLVCQDEVMKIQKAALQDKEQIITAQKCLALKNAAIWNCRRTASSFFSSTSPPASTCKLRSETVNSPLVQ